MVALGFKIGTHQHRWSFGSRQNDLDSLVSSASSHWLYPALQRRSTSHNEYLWSLCVCFLLTWKTFCWTVLTVIFIPDNSFRFTVSLDQFTSRRKRRWRTDWKNRTSRKMTVTRVRESWLTFFEMVSTKIPVFSCSYFKLFGGKYKLRSENPVDLFFKDGQSTQWYIYNWHNDLDVLHRDNYKQSDMA